jgi:ribonucleoside-diphosphate reductase alpha chain
MITNAIGLKLNLHGTFEMTSIYRELSIERKRLQKEGKLPEWVITNSWQLLKEKYVSEKYPDLHSIYTRIAKHASTYTDSPAAWETKFFELLWNGWLIPSTPVCANMGTGNGCPVSCSGSTVQDSVFDFYAKQQEAAVLSQQGYGTSNYLGRIRKRGAPITGVAGSASGVLPVFKGFVKVAQDISQGSQRRGAWAGYLEIEHGDFDELATHILNFPDDANVGWIISDDFTRRLAAGDKDALRRYQKAMKLRLLGKGYFFFKDKVNRANPHAYKRRDLEVNASNLCTEITLFSGIHEDEEYTFSCVLSSMNASKYDEWKGTDAVFNATVFLDCVNEDQIRIGRTKPGMERITRFAEKSRALGLGLLGFHSYLQQNMIPFESFDAHLVSQEIFKYLNTESLMASKWMAKVWGEPEWCLELGIRNTHRIAIAPNLSSSLIAGGMSQGIEPIYKNAFVQNTAGGKMRRSSPMLVHLIEKAGLNVQDTLKDIIRNNGSVQHVEWLSDFEKDVFKTAFEINQKTILKLAAARQPYIDQAQSINLFFDADESEEYISEIHQEAFELEGIKSLYYIRTTNGARTNKDECISCHG